jgi:hypothetical protein
VTSNIPTPHQDAPVEATVVTSLVLAAFGLPMTAAAAAFAFGGLEHIGEGFLVAFAVWVGGIAVSLVQPFRVAPADDVMPPALRWGLAALAVAALSAVVASSAPLLPWTLVLLVGPFFAWISGSLFLLGRERRSTR